MEPEYAHTVRVTSEVDDLVRSRLTVFFRLLLALPHIIWFVLWGIIALLTAIPADQAFLLVAVASIAGFAAGVGATPLFALPSLAVDPARAATAPR